MSSICPECEHLEEASTFCTVCGSRLHPLAAIQTPAVAPVTFPVTNDIPTRTAESGWAKAGRVVDGVATGVTILVGIGWLVVGIVLLGFAFTGKAPILFLLGPLCIVYAIYLFKPGGWKLIIY